MKRIKRTQATVYHCITRAVAGEQLLKTNSKEVLRTMLWKVAGFCGVEVLAYCLMSNHFHVLVRVPEQGQLLTREEVLRRYRILYEVSNVRGYPDASVLEAIFASGDEELIEDWMLRLTARMGDVSEFMRTLKHRLTVWFNKTHRRFGTLWAERFKSIVVQNRPEVLRTVAAYLDLNPVRAGLVEDPADYRWCSYAEAMAGHPLAGAGLACTVGHREWAQAAADYRVILFGKGGVVKRSGQASIPWEKVKAVLEAGGKVPEHELLRCKVRYFTEGAVIGSKEFVESVAGGLKVGVSAGADGSLEEGDMSATGEAATKGKEKRTYTKNRGVIPVASAEELNTLHHLSRESVGAPARES